MFQKTKYDTDKSELENKIPNTNDLVKENDYNPKIAEIESKTSDISNLITKTALTTVENKIPSVSNLATKTTLTAIENKIPSISNLVKKTDCNTKVTEIENKLDNHDHDEYIDTSEFNKLAVDAFNARMTQANLITKTVFDAELSSLNRKITKDKTDHLIVKNELNKLKTFDSGYFIGIGHFENDGTQNYLVFQPIFRYSKLNTVINVKDYVLSLKYKGLSAETIKPPSTSDNSLTPALSYDRASNIRAKFTGSCLKQDKVIFNHRNVVTIYIIYELGTSTSNISDPTIKSCLFGAVTLTKNADIDKYRYSDHGIGFGGTGSFSFPGDRFGQNVTIFGADMNSSPHIDNKGKGILMLGIGPTQGLGENSLAAEKMYSMNFTVIKKNCLSYIIMEQIVTYLLMVQKFTNLKQKILKLQQVNYV